MAYSRAEDEVRKFIERTKVPFLASPMGKGVMPDNHPLSVGAARSHALQNADVVFLMGARLNWIMHFGLPPRYNKTVRFVQLDISAEQIGQNAPTDSGCASGITPLPMGEARNGTLVRSMNFRTSSSARE